MPGARSMFLLAVLAGSAHAAGTLTAAGVAVASTDPGCGVIPVAQRSGAVIYGLSHSFLRPGSDSVWTATRPWTRGTDYAIDRAKGALRLLREPVPGETLWVHVCWLLDPPPAEVQRNVYRPVLATAPAVKDSAPPAPAVPRPITSRDPGRASPGASLALNGNKTIAVDFGSSQDAFLRQSLDLSVSGSLAPGVDLTGVFSDQSVPLGAAGATRDLQAVDRLLLELKGPQGGAALGDVSLDLAQGEFGRLTRQVQGMRAEWRHGDAQALVAAATAQGEYHTLQFLGVEGRQGPYTLTDRNGSPGVSVVPGSEVVHLDGERLTRGEGADYFVEYETARLTFTNRRPITSSSRVAVDYQYTVNRFRRNLTLAQARWNRGPWFGFTSFLHEQDDRGRPVDAVLGPGERLLLEAAGDSAGLALGGGVSVGSGDYDLVQDSLTSYYAFAGPDSGSYQVRFAAVPAGSGDYVDSAAVAGRTIFHYVGPGNGTHRVGHALPLPDSHQLWAMGAGMSHGVLRTEVEGAVSRLDRNTFSSLDDGDNLGVAGNARVALEGRPPGALGGTWGIGLRGRSVDERFAPFARLEQPFVHEDWGFATPGRLERHRRVEADAHLAPEFGGELRGTLGQLRTTDGLTSLRQTLDWFRDGTIAIRLHWEQSDREEPGRDFERGGRDRRSAELGLRLPWLEPRVRYDWDERRVPSDSLPVGLRSKEGAAELRTPRAWTWKGTVGLVLRREQQLETGGFADRSDASTARIGLETPAGRAVSGALTVQRRVLETIPVPSRLRSDLASGWLRAADARRGLTGSVAVEITTEGETRRTRALRRVADGQGAYDSLGNFVGTGDYDLVLETVPGLDRLARAATSARGEWRFGVSDAWRGSRFEASFEIDARRRGGLRGSDPVLSPGAAEHDAGLARGAVVQRLEADLAPASAFGAVRLRVEQRVTGDRSFSNFAQFVGERSASSRWRTRPGPSLSAELEVRGRRQEATQELSGLAPFRRILRESAGTGLLTYTPHARLRTAAVVEASWVRPDAPAGAETSTRVLRAGPDLALGFSARGRAELTLRRSFVSGSPLVSLLPSALPADPPRWESTLRMDYSMRSSTQISLSVVHREHEQREAELTGRAEVRAFF